MRRSDDAVNLVKVKIMLYYGCYVNVGHYLYEPGMVSVNWRDRPDLDKSIDGGYYPTKPELANGVTLLTHENNKTILGFSDNSVDLRQGSHSTFVEEGILPFDKMLSKCKEAFPQVFARFKFNVTEVQRCDGQCGS